MANVKISNLTAATTPVAGTEVLPIVQSGATVKVSIANLTAGRSVSATGLALAGSTSGTVTLTAKAVAGSSTFRLPSADGTSGQFMSTDGSGNLSFASASASQWTTSGSNIYYASGNVGINTSSTPDAFLQVYAAAGKAATFGNNVNNNGNYIVLGGTSSNKNWVLSNNMIVGGEFGIGRTSANGGTTIGSAHDLSIDQNGNLLVGTTSQILSNTKFNFSSSQATALGSMGFVNTVAPTIKWQIGPDAAGNFVVFNGSAVGVYVANGGTAWTAYSDERLKTTIIPFENAAAKVATLRAGTGRYLKDAEGTSRSFLIAQDVQKVLPEAIDTNNPDALGLSYTDVIPLLVAAINEQSALITTLTDRITALESA